jgi:TPR repeat protein
MPTYDPDSPVCDSDGGADHLRRGRTLLRSCASPAERARGFEHLEAAVALGCPAAMGELSISMQLDATRAFTDADKRRIFELAKRGHELGCADSTAAVARCYRNGFGTPADLPLAVALSSTLAASGHPLGLFVYGGCLYHGMGVTKNADKALVMWRQAAGRGCFRSAYNVAVAIKGANTDEAQIWFLRASRMGDIEAMVSMTDDYFRKGTCST